MDKNPDDEILSLLAEMTDKEIEQYLLSLDEDEHREVIKLLADAPIWFPLEGPQMAAYLSEADVIGYGGAAGGGKGLALDTLLPTPKGFVAMGEVAVGDQLFDENGVVCTVTAVSEVSHRPCFKLTFDDGSEIIADDVHRWVTFDAKELTALKHSKSDGTLRDTLEISNSLMAQSGKPNHAIQSTNIFRYIVACEPVPSVPTKCIAVDSASRQYLAGINGIPTHNTDLLAGLSLNIHKRVLIVRREKAQTDGIVQRIEEIIGHKNGYNSQKSAWRLDDGRLLEFGGLDNIGDEKRWQGRAHDLKALDEATEIRESQARFIMGWNRTSDASIKPKCLLTFNPPTTAEGRWVLDYFAPWLQKGYPNPAQPGELRYFAMIGDKEQEVERAEPFVLVDGAPCYEFDPDQFKPELIIKPKSRTFIPARVTDNKYYMETGYMNTLQSLPEPLRSQMLYGDFGAGIEDDPWQIIPTAWVEAAQARWKPLDEMRMLNPNNFEMDAYGLDVARGGRDETIGYARYQHWYADADTLAGSDSLDGPRVASFAVGNTRDHAPIHIDVIGVGASPYDFLHQSGMHVVPVDVRQSATSFDRSGQLSFFNLRSQLWWQFREILDPAYGSVVALPPDPKLLADLTAPRWSLQGKNIKAESREDIVKRIGRSPDRGSAIIMAQMNTPKRHIMQMIDSSNARRNYDPYA